MQKTQGQRGQVSSPLFSCSSTPHLPWRTARRDAEFLSSFSRPTESRLKPSGTPEHSPSPQSSPFVFRGQLRLLLLFCPQAWFLASKGVKYILPHGLSCLYHPEEGLRVDSKVPPSNTGHIRWTYRTCLSGSWGHSLLFPGGLTALTIIISNVFHYISWWYYHYKEMLMVFFLQPVYSET